MATGICPGCEERKTLYDGVCIVCISKGRSPGMDLEAATEPELPESMERGSGDYRRHGGRHSRHGSFAPSPGFHAPHPHVHGHHMTAAERARLPDSAFALIRRNAAGQVILRDLPLRSEHPGSAPDYIKAASGRLNMMRNLGHLQSGEYQQAGRRIAAAAKREGMHSMFARS